MCHGPRPGMSTGFQASSAGPTLACRLVGRRASLVVRPVCPRTRHGSRPVDVRSKLGRRRILLVSIVRFFETRSSWECLAGESEERGMYRYALSFNGAYPVRYQPDVFGYLGVEPLDIELGPRGQVRVHPCRVTNGCPDHFTPSEILHWNTDPLFVEKVTELENNARQIELAPLGLCLLGGPCSQRAFTPYEEDTDDPLTNPPWQNLRPCHS